MLTASYCDCLICRMEASFIAELSDGRSNEEFRLFAVSSPVPSAFGNPIELARKLQDPDNHDQHPSSDDVHFDLLGRGSDVQFHSVWQRLLLLVFIPTIYRTTSQIIGTFPLLARDDTAHHLFAVLLEFLHFKELRLRHSHLGFTVARKLRRSAFRRANREAHRSLWNDTNGTSTTVVETGHRPGTRRKMGYTGQTIQTKMKWKIRFISLGKLRQHERVDR